MTRPAIRDRRYGFAQGITRGFTLIELLVVIGIIALLIALAVPALGWARQKSNDVTCKANLKSIYSATMLYANDHKGRFPDKYTLGGYSFRAGAGWKRDSADDPFSLAETYGMPALYDKMGYLSNSVEEPGVWVCPGQPDWMQALGNTYVWTLFAKLEDVTVFELAKPEYDHAPLIWDNYSFNAFMPGVRYSPGVRPPATIPMQDRVFPHNYQAPYADNEAGRSQGSANYLFLNGGTGGRIFRLKPGSSSFDQITYRD